MFKPGGALDKIKSNEQIINQIYATAFRLTGERQSTEALTVKAINTVIRRKKELTLQAALKGLCTSFLRNPGPEPLRDSGDKNWSPCHRAVSSEQVQRALLCLEPVERLVLVLREMWQLSYGEIANLTELDKDKVAKALAQGRMGLRKCFFRR